MALPYPTVTGGRSAVLAAFVEGRRHRFRAITPYGLTLVAIASMLAVSGCGSEKKGSEKAPRSSTTTTDGSSRPRSAGSASSAAKPAGGKPSEQSSSGSPAQRVERHLKRFENEYFLVDLPPGWQVRGRPSSSVLFEHRRGGALIRAKVIPGTAVSRYTERLQRSIQHDPRVHGLSVAHVLFNSTPATRFDFSRNGRHTIVYLFPYGADGTVAVEAEAPRATYARFSQFFTRLGDYFGRKDLD